MILQSFIRLYVISVIPNNVTKSGALLSFHPLQDTKNHPLSGFHYYLFNILELSSITSRQCGNICIPNVFRSIPNSATNVKMKDNI
jgi:hypothetical protein